MQIWVCKQFDFVRLQMYVGLEIENMLYSVAVVNSWSKCLDLIVQL